MHIPDGLEGNHKLAVWTLMPEISREAIMFFADLNLYGEQMARLSRFGASLPITLDLEP